MRPMLLPALPLLLASLAGPAPASTDDAWTEFRARVEDACLALTAEIPGEAKVVVNPFGSESYGAAIVTVKGEGGTDTMICIFDKATGAAELTAPFALPAG